MQLQQKMPSRRIIFHSLQGTQHEENQDNTLMIEADQLRLFIVFDGVSSARHAKLATELSKTFVANNYAQYQKSDRFRLSDLMHDVNSHLLHEQTRDLKTTYCAAYFLTNSPETVWISHLGDSRAYVVSSQFMEQLTRDHSHASMKNVITKCLGMADLSSKDFVTTKHPIYADQKLLLCTDGFWSVLDTHWREFFDAFQMKRPHNIKEKLYRLIKGHNTDDSTYILIT